MKFTKSIAFTLVALTTMLSATEEPDECSAFLKGEITSSLCLTQKKLSQSNQLSIEIGHQSAVSNSCLRLGSDMTSKNLKLSMVKKLYFMNKLYEDHGISIDSNLGLQPFTDAFFFKGKKPPHNIFVGMLLKGQFENDAFQAYVKTGLSCPTNLKISDVVLKKGFAVEVGIEKMFAVPAYIKATYGNYDKHYQPLQLAIGYKNNLCQIPYDFHIGGVSNHYLENKISELFANLSLGSTKEVHDMKLELKAHYVHTPKEELNYSAACKRRLHEHLVLSLAFDKTGGAYKETIAFVSSF